MLSLALSIAVATNRTLVPDPTADWFALHPLPLSLVVLLVCDPSLGVDFLASDTRLLLPRQNDALLRCGT
eukprot:970479-Rhodomonas_salina.1